MRLAGLALAFSTLVPAYAQSPEDFYRRNPVNLLVGSGAGGGFDTYARIFAQHFGKHVPGNPQVIVRNMPGAAGLVAMNHLYNSAPRDGSTILASFNTIVMHQLYGDANAKFDPRQLGWLGSTGKLTGACLSWHTSNLRTIEDAKDRLVTILVAPLMSCSARLPVYLLMIAALVPGERVPLTTKVGLMLLMYFLGTAGAFGFAWLFKRTLLKGVPPMMIMELPPYRLPGLKDVALHMLERAWIFLRRAGTVILGISIVLWFLSTTGVWTLVAITKRGPRLAPRDEAPVPAARAADGTPIYPAGRPYSAIRAEVYPAGSVRGSASV